jgi:hypothetical protein
VTFVETLDVALAAAATLVAVAFGLSTFDRWSRRRRPYELAWTIALLLFALGAGALWWAEARGWSGPTFRVFFLAGAILNVPWLALGTVYLVAGTATGHRVRAWLVFLSGLAVGVMVSTPLKGAVPADELPEGRELFGALPRVLAAVGSGVSAIVILAGALWTTWQFLRTRSAPPGRVAGNLLIAAGTLVLSASGTLAGRLGEDRSFIVTLLVGIVILFAGFLVAGTRPARSVSRTATPSHELQPVDATAPDAQRSRVAG